jgi:hypothetical protein
MTVTLRIGSSRAFDGSTLVGTIDPNSHASRYGSGIGGVVPIRRVYGHII